MTILTVYPYSGISFSLHPAALSDTKSYTLWAVLCLTLNHAGADIPDMSFLYPHLGAFRERDERSRSSGRSRRAPASGLLLKSRRVRRGALEALGPGSPGVLISGHYGC